ncbi:MAG: phosphoribosylamine--glycine ligase [Elusimicrobiota bacterium]|jgi:phosphoribosylamine--glycine ligase
MNVLLIGSGGREHCLAWALRRSPRLTRLYAAPGSQGMTPLAENAAVDPFDPAALAAFCKERAVGLVVIGPEAPLAAGISDALTAAGVRVFGPNKACASLEASKSRAKEFMRRHEIPTARFAVCSTLQEALAALPSFGPCVVVKADGLAAGKGVIVCRQKGEAESALRAIMKDRVHGDAGRLVVLEELLEGREATLMALLDGKRYLLLPSSQDHKRLSDADQGPNTGGMGAVSPAPSLSPALLAQARREIFDRALAGLQSEGLDYRGVLYAGIMLTPQGPKLLEFNARFGDPETQAVLPLLDEDLLSLLEAAADGRLPERELKVRPGASVCVVLASGGYPEKSSAPETIQGLSPCAQEEDGPWVFHAGTRREKEIWLAGGGRVLGVTALGPNQEEARRRAYAAVEKIRFKGMRYRRDIGAASPACAY